MHIKFEFEAETHNKRSREDDEFAQMTDMEEFEKEKMEEQKKIWKELHRVLENEYYNRYGAREKEVWNTPTAKLIEGDVANVTRTEKTVLRDMLEDNETDEMKFARLTEGKYRGGKVAIRATTPMDYAEDSKVNFICDSSEFISFRYNEYKSQQKIKEVIK